MSAEFQPPSYDELQNALFNNKPSDNDEPIEIIDMTNEEKGRHKKSRKNKSRHNNIPMVDITNDEEKMETNKMISMVKAMKFMNNKIKHNLIDEIS